MKIIKLLSWGSGELEEVKYLHIDIMIYVYTVNYIHNKYIYLDVLFSMIYIYAW